MADKGVINRANDFWLNSKFSWLFEPWGGCCASRDDDLQSERSSMLPKKNQFLQQDQQEFQMYDSDDQQNKYDIDESLEFNQDWLPEYNHNDSQNYSPTNLIVNQAISFPQDQKKQTPFDHNQVLNQVLEENEKPYTITEYPDLLTEDEMESNSRQSLVPLIERKTIKKQKRPSIKIEKKKKQKKFRNPWQNHEDEQLLQLVSKHGYSWSLISQMIAGRTGKQVRDRYLNKLNPGINKEKWSQEEDEMIVSLFYEKGSKWSEIAKCLEGRTESQVKNRFYSYIRKKFLPREEEGIDQISSNITSNKTSNKTSIKTSNTIRNSQALYNSNLGGNDKMVNDETVVENKNNLSINITAPSLLSHNSIANEQNLFSQQNIDMTASPSVSNLISPILISTCDLNDGIYNPGYNTNNQFENYHERQDFGHFKFEEDPHMDDDYLYDSCGDKHELIDNGSLINNLNPHYAQYMQKIDFIQDHPQTPLQSNGLNYNNGLIFMNNNYNETISVSNRETPQVPRRLNDDADGNSPEYSVSSPETNNSNGDGEIDNRLDKLAILFEKNKLDLEELKSLDTMSIIKSSNSSEAMVSETSHPLQKIERIDLLSKRTKKLEYLLAKTYQEIQKISKPENQQKVN